MSRHRVRARDYIEHMLEACRRIRSYTESKDFAGFAQEPLLQDAVIRNLTLLGEACGQLLQVLPEAEIRFPAVPYRTIYSTRNHLIHGYHTLELAPIWAIVRNEIPLLTTELTVFFPHGPPILTRRA
jgi:uncharacterized protein with HEPN domain